MKTLRLAILLSIALSPSHVFAQPETIDYAITISEGGVPTTGGEVVYAFIVTADWWTITLPPFTVRAIVPPGLEPVSRCTGDMQFDTATRVLTWADRLDNQVSAFNSCPLVFRIDPSLLPGTTFDIHATLTVSGPDRIPTNNSATFTGRVIPSSDLEVTSASDIRTYKPGAMVTYTFTVTNYGPQDAAEVSVVDEVSEHLTVVSLEQLSGAPAFVGRSEAVIPLLRAGSSATFRLSARANTNFEAANVRNHVVVRSSSSVDLVLRNNEADVWTFAGPDADLIVDSARLQQSSPLRIPVTIHVKNNGPDAVNNVMIANALVGTDAFYDLVENVQFVSATPSQGTCSPPVQAEIIATPPPPPYWSLDCSLGSLPAGADATITIVIERTAKSGAFRLFSSAAPAHNDPQAQNNTGHLAFDALTSRRRAVRR